MSAEPKRVELTEAEMELAESLVACECGHGLDTHNGLGCYERLSYEPLTTCPCMLTDDRTDAELLAQRLPAYVAAREAAARREALLEGEGKHQFVLSQTWNDGWASGVADAACWQRGEDVQATRNPYGTEVGDRITTALTEPERDPVREADEVRKQVRG